jgi:hypothetical protein
MIGSFFHLTNAKFRKAGYYETWNFMCRNIFFYCHQCKFSGL